MFKFSSITDDICNTDVKQDNARLYCDDIMVFCASQQFDDHMHATLKSDVRFRVAKEITRQVHRGARSSININVL